MINDTVLITAIDNISGKLGIAATEIFTIFAEAQMIKGITGIIAVMIVVVLSYMTFKCIFKWLTGYSTFREAKEDKDDIIDYSSDVDGATWMSVIATAVLAMVYLIVVSILRDGCLAIACPEYMAMTEIIGYFT